MPSLWKILVLGGLKCIFLCASSEPYNGYQILESRPTTIRELKLLRRIIFQSRLEPKEEVWKMSGSPGDSSVIFAKARKVKRIRKELGAKGVPATILAQNIEKKLNTEKQERADRTIFSSDLGPEGFTFHQYHNYSEILELYEALERKYGNLIQFKTIGQSFQNESITLLKISWLNNVSDRRAIFIESGVHAREWISHAATLFLVAEILSLLTSEKEDTEVVKLLKKFDWYILPVANPDGYRFSWECDRFWRKSRSINAVVEEQCDEIRYFDDNVNCYHCVCIGADINRNFDIGWGFDGRCSQNNHCCSTYQGTKPFSESETRAIVNFIRKEEQSIDVYLGIHAFSQLWMWPYAFNKSQPPDWPNLEKYAERIVEKMFQVNGTRYKTGAAHQMLYRASGTSMDWVRSKTEIPYAFGIELRPEGTGQHYAGFILPSQEIIPASQELFAGLVELLRCVSHSQRFSAFPSLYLLTTTFIVSFSYSITT